MTSYRDGVEELVSADGQTVLIIVTLSGDEDDADEVVGPLVDLVHAVDGTEGFRVTTVGFGSVGLEFSDLIAETLEQGELRLADSIALFESGIVLSRAGTERLDDAEGRVETLLANGRTTPFTEKGRGTSGER